MMVSSEGTKVRFWARLIQENRLKMRAKKLIVPLLCPDFVVTIGPYVSISLSECMAGTTAHSQKGGTFPALLEKQASLVRPWC